MITSTKEKVNSQENLLGEIADVKDISNESAASIQGGQAFLYEHINYGGRKLTFSFGSNDLRDYDFNDEASSFKVSEGTWRLYEDINYEGKFATFEVGTNDLRDFNFNDEVSSILRIA